MTGGSTKKIKCMGGVGEKNKMCGGASKVFSSPSPLRISNGIALTKSVYWETKSRKVHVDKSLSTVLKSILKVSRTILIQILKMQLDVGSEPYLSTAKALCLIISNTFYYKSFANGQRIELFSPIFGQVQTDRRQTDRRTDRQTQSDI